MEQIMQNEQPAALSEEADAPCTQELAPQELDTAAQQNGETDAGQTAAQPSPDEVQSAAFVRVKFNKHERSYTSQEAAPLVEMGLKWDSFRASHDKLRYLAEAHGQTVGQLIDGLMLSSDKRLYRQLVEECGGNEMAANQLLEGKKAERQRRCEQSRAEEQQREQQEEIEQRGQWQQRLAEEYRILETEVPGRFARFSDVPDAVLALAAQENIPLLDAYLRTEYRDMQRRNHERAQQEAAAARSTGSLGGAHNLPAPELDSFEQAFYQALQ